MKIFKPRFWDYNYSSFLAILLFPIAILIQFFSLIKKLATRKKVFSIPVICVGNIYLGGTGKTPLSVKLYEILKKLNKNPAIIKKFYQEHFDEINFIKEKVENIFVHSSRVKAVAQAIERKVKTIILDDGFQDSSIKKDLNILCFNSNQLIGNGMTLPSGPLRETLASVKKANIVIINGNKSEDFEKKILKLSNNKIKIFYSNYFPKNIEKFENKKLLAFAGIGNPSNFFNLLKSYNLKIEKTFSFPDHYKYSQKDLKNLIDLSKSNDLELITTEKDYYRIKNFNFEEIKYLSVTLKINEEKKLIDEIKKYTV